jgi:DNA-binding SARP family transcriptional activator
VARSRGDRPLLKTWQVDAKKPLRRRLVAGFRPLLASVGAMDFRILGPLEVCDGERVLQLGGAKQRALLAVLLLHANEVVSAERLLDDVWGERQPGSGAKALHVYVSQLRKAVGDDRVLTRAPGYSLRVGADELDAARFRRLCELAEAAEPEQARAILAEALALWRGPALAEFQYETFAQAEIARLDELRTTALEQRIEADLALGHDSELVAELESLVKKHPLRERLRAQLMLALYRAGRQAEALEVYQEGRRSLVDEIGIEPGRQLRELHLAILRQDASLDLPSKPPEVPEQAPGFFVGREAELEQLRGGLDAAAAGHGRLFLLVGEPGIGKSRLADQATGVARARGFRVLVGRCWEAGGAPAYWPWVQSLRELAQEAPAELDLLLRGEPIGSDTESARFQLFDATARFLRSASRAQPLFLFLDDMHAADAPSLLLLQFVARELTDTRVVIVAACRDVDPVPGRQLSATLAALVREPVTIRIALRGLNEEEVTEYVECAASDLASSELTASLYEETEGNPLFVVETVRLLVVEGRIAIPETLRDVISRRLAHLSGECNRVLVLASVLGRDFPIGPLVHMSGIREDELLDVLDEATAARIISDAPNGLRFSHVLVRDVLYESFTAPRRARMHRLSFEALEKVFGADSGPHVAELAHHAMLGSEFEKALVAARRAGKRALEVLAYEEAARLYRIALHALGRVRPDDEETRCELLLSLGEAEIRAGETESAREVFAEAATIARRLGLPRALARAAHGYGGRIVWVRGGDDTRLVPLLEEALAALPVDELELRSRLLARLAGALRDEHSRARREELSGEALKLARASDNPAAVAYALDAHAYAIIAPDTMHRCLELARELGDAALQTGDKERVVASHMLASMALIVLGDVAGTEREVEAAVRAADELRQGPQLAQVQGVQAMLLLAKGRFEEGERLATQRFELGRHALPQASVAIYSCQRYALRDLRDDLPGVDREIADVVAAFPARPVFRCVLAHVWARLGRSEEAARELRPLAENQAAALPFDQEWLFGMSLLAETAALLADVDAAAELYNPLTPWCNLNAADVAEGCRGAVSRYLGLLAETLELWDDAEDHFERALAMNQDMGFRPWLAHTLHDYARMLRKRRATGDEARAKQLLGQAVETYRELGMPTDAAEASAVTPR